MIKEKGVWKELSRVVEEEEDLELPIVIIRKIKRKRRSGNER